MRSALTIKQTSEIYCSDYRLRGCIAAKEEGIQRAGKLSVLTVKC